MIAAPVSWCWEENITRYWWPRRPADQNECLSVLTSHTPQFPPWHTVNTWQDCVARSFVFYMPLEQYHSYGRHLDYVMIGHFHQAMEIFNCFVNGSMVGYNEYARDLRLRPEPPCQWLLNIHPETGIITNQRKIWVRNFPKEAVAVLPWETEV